MPELRPILKWAGGKRYLVPKLKEYYDPSRRLVEPFVGGMAVALGLQPKQALLNDINVDLINFYNCVQKGLYIGYTLENNRNMYLTIREMFNRRLFTGAAQAGLFYYLNRTCFNGLCRYNRKGEFNTSFGQYKTINYKYDFTEYKDIFSKWDFTCGDFSEIDIKKDDFLYCDPPYDVQFTNYSKEDFKWADQIRLVEWLSDMDCPIIVSNSATDRIIKLYTDNDFDIEFLDAPRRIAGNGDRTPAKEILAKKEYMNNEAKLIEMIRKLIDTMEMQEQREKGLFHITQQCMIGIWTDAKAEARTLINKIESNK